MRRLGLVFAWLVLVLSAASAIAGVIDLSSQSRKRAAIRCEGQRDGNCWIDVRGTIDDARECGRSACTVRINAAVDGALMHGHILVARDIASQLHADEPVDARVLADDVLWLRTAGVEARDRALQPQARSNSELALAVLAAAAILSWFAIGRLHRDDATPWTRIQWSRIGHGALIICGAVSLAIFAWIGVDTWPFVHAYESAQTCSTPARDCRLRTDARIVHKRCDRGWVWFCALTLRYSGDHETRDALANVAGKDARSIGDAASIEVFHDEITRLFVDGHEITPDNGPQTRLRSVTYCSAIALALLAWGVFGLVSRCRQPT